MATLKRRTLSDDAVAASLIPVGIKWKSDFNRGDFAACVSAYRDDARLHANLGPAAAFLKEKCGLPNPAVFDGKDQITMWWKTGMEVVGLKGMQAYEEAGHPYACTVMIVGDNKAVLQGKFRMNAIAGQIHAETWVRESTSAPWLLESDFFSIEEMPAGIPMAMPRGLADDVVAASLVPVGNSWKAAFNRGDYAACAAAYQDGAKVHADLGPAAAFLKEKCGLSNPAVFVGKEQITLWWKTGMEVVGLKDMRAYEAAGGDFPCKVMIVNDNKAVLQGKFRFNACAGTIHAETWVRASPSDPWLLESDFFSIEQMPAGVTLPPEVPPGEQLARIRTLFKQRAGGMCEVTAEAMLTLMRELDPAFPKECIDSLISGCGCTGTPLVNIDRFLSFAFLSQLDPKALGLTFGTATNTAKRERLRTMKVFVMDNSLRESTVGQTRGHTPVDKLDIYKAGKSCGFKYFVVAAFSSQRRVDDAFVERVRAEGEDFTNFFAFTEDADGSKDGHMLFGPDHIPIAMQKMKKYGVPNPIIEIDVADKSICWDTFPVMDMFKFLFTWQKENLGASSRSFVNLRDFPTAMCMCPGRLLSLVHSLGSLPVDLRPMGIFVEDPLGTFFADEIGAWTRGIRQVMDAVGWVSDGETTGLLLVHAHKNWGLADAVVLDMLAEGADGIWCSLCEEGAAQGHACSAVTLANLARLGNRDVRTRFVTKNLGKAARAVTKITTDREVHARQTVYGPRAVEAVFDFAGIAGGLKDQSFDRNEDGIVDDIDRFSLAEFLGVEDPPVRITTLASCRLVVVRLQQLFGDHPTYTEETAAKMKQGMMDDLHAGRKEEYSSAIGLAMLYQQVMLTITPGMQKAIGEAKVSKPLFDKLLAESKVIFEEMAQEGGDKESIDYAGFYNGYLQPYFGCFTCETTKDILDAIDTDESKNITWDEWRFWLVWAFRQFPEEIRSIDDLNETVFRHAILPSFLAKKKPDKKA